MITLSILIMLVGSVLAMRLKVLSLVPATALALIAIGGIGAARGDRLGSIILAVTMAATCLQMGYLGGCALRAAFADVPPPHRRRIKTPTRLVGRQAVRA